MDNNKRKALQAQIKEIQEEGVRNVGYWYGVFGELDISYLFELLADVINNNSFSRDIKGSQLMDIALQSYIDDIDLEDDLDLMDFAKFNTYFMNHRTYEAELNKNEKR